MLDTDVERIYADIQEGRPTWIPASIPEHILSIAIHGNAIAIGNRGDLIDYAEDMHRLNKPGSYFLEIPNRKEVFTKTFINELLSSDNKEALQSLQRIEYIRIERMRKRAQRRSNCTYACAKLFIRDHLMFFISQQKGISIFGKTKERAQASKELLLLYRDFAILSRMLVFNAYVQEYFDSENPAEQELIATMYASIKKRVSKDATSESQCFQVIDVRDDNGNEIPILDQLHPEGRHAAEEVLAQKLPWLEYLMYWYHRLDEALLSQNG